MYYLSKILIRNLPWDPWLPRYNMGRNSEKEITEDVRKMQNWFDMNKLTLNVEKCESISFGRAQPVSEEAFGEKISCKRSCKYLGVLTDNKLNFKIMLILCQKTEQILRAGI